MSWSLTPHTMNCLIALGENPTDTDNEHTSVSKFAINKHELSFGMISGQNLNFYNEDIDRLENNTRVFRFDQCDTENLTQSKITFPYVPSSLAYNDFIILSNIPYKNWQPQSMNNPPFLNDNDVLRNISVCLFEKLKKKDERINILQTQNTQKDEMIVSLQNKLEKEHKIFIVC